MALHQRPGPRTDRDLTNGSAPVPDPGTSAVPGHPAAGSAAPARTAAAARLLTALTFLWAFGDKTFGWGYATPAGKGWIDGGSPTRGFLSGVSAGPLEEVFHSWAGAAWADWLFMLGLLGIGVALASGVALRATAVAGTLMMALMWAAEWPPARHLSDGAPSMSTNPLVDYHVLYAALLMVLAVTCAGRTWGLGSWWERQPLVRRNRWLR
ncbi:hypothetical protein ABZ686_16805 [Streptomyces sp. NPDC006992]|uniref:hypothetical protein n=1 Tax=unclassified Streptomyces TaxID=2593676 RepID=UPI0033F98897